MTLTFIGHRLPLDGYGYATIQIGDEMKRLDPTVRIVDMSDGEHFATRDQHWFIDGTAIALCTPDWLPHIMAERLISYTMFEATRLPREWPELISLYAEACCVPSAWCAGVFDGNGVNVPIEVVKWGINPLDYYPLDRRDHAAPYTFLWSGTPDLRKGWDVAYLAFTRAFGRRDDVRLHLHFRDALPGNPYWTDPNVKVTVGKFNRPILRVMLQEADAFVFPSRGEGWGSPPREAAATGLPVIVTDHGGLAEERPHWAFGIGVDGESLAEYGRWEAGEIGAWVEPRVEDLVEWMRLAVEHREMMRESGRRAALWLRQNATWERTARQLLALERIAA